ncbi:MAG: tetratricopeptide repeat protein [Burkholderiales bacterium]|nr:tetratricopeptide repeat protein [Burkholderiales bacterium]
MLIFVVAVAAVAAVWLGWRTWPRETGAGSPPAPLAAAFAGSAACAACHAEPAAAWGKSQHARAMQAASGATVRGDFENVEFRHAGTTSRFFRREGRFMVRTDGPGGNLADFEVKFTFGVAPLQQYLLELPGGRLQALSVAWDTERKQWFHLYPGERIGHRDELHWTGRQHNWNFMCADCHSMDVRKNYDGQARAYRTTWKEMTVGCESCHGPGSAHIEWARRGGKGPAAGLTVRLDERRGAGWAIDPHTGSSVRSVPRASEREIEVCAQCHSRRAQFAEGYHAGKRFLDHYSPSLLTAPLYHADGQQREEVYTWGSFLQSRMYARGVTCGDCHEPHSGKLRAARPDSVCLGCHAADRFAVTAHHLHEPGSKGASCVECHMPATNYMVVDPRRDHGFRVPRPDLSATLGTPNACNGCHAERTARWAADAIAAAHGSERKGHQNHAPVLAAARRNHPNAGRLLAALATDAAAPAIARATALRELARDPFPGAALAVQRTAGSSDPLLRLAAAEALEALAPGERIRPGATLLGDSLRAVRMAAGLAMADVPDSALEPAQLDARRSALDEYTTAQQHGSERPESHLNLGLLALRQGRADDAEGHYRAAVALAPDYAPAYVNLADLHRARGSEDAGERVLREGLDRAGASAELWHALGLLHARRRHYDAALAALARAVKIAPENDRYQYVLAVALHDRGRGREAVRVLEEVLRRNPVERDVLIALTKYLSEQGRREAALGHARTLVTLAPDDAALGDLLAALERAR